MLKLTSKKLAVFRKAAELMNRKAGNNRFALLTADNQAMTIDLGGETITFPLKPPPEPKPRRRSRPSKPPRKSRPPRKSGPKSSRTPSPASQTPPPPPQSLPPTG